MRKVTLKGGPLDGKTYLVPETQETLTHHAAPGAYKLTAARGTWKAERTKRTTTD